MKLITLIISFALAVSFCNAQLSYSNATTPMLSSDTSQMGATVWIHNGSATYDSVKCERTIVYLTPGHGTNFCWDVCYADEAHSQSDHPVYIAAGTDNYSFHGYLNPHGVYGVDTVCYNFYNIANIADAVYVCFAYDNTTGIQVLGASPTNPLSEPSPNPASNMTAINYSVSGTDARIVVFNLLGNAVKEIKLSEKQGALILTTSDLGQGIYYYSLFANGKMLSTKKLVVAHR